MRKPDEISQYSQEDDYVPLSILLVGSERVGKTKLINRFVKGIYIEEYIRHAAADFCTKEFMYGESKLMLKIRDARFSHRDGFASYGRLLSNADIIMCVYDVTDIASFNNIRDITPTTNDYMKNSSIKMLVGNRTDLSHLTAIESLSAKRFADSEDMPFIETSGKNGANVEALFLTSVAQLFLKRGILTFQQTQAHFKSLQTSALLESKADIQAARNIFGILKSLLNVDTKEDILIEELIIALERGFDLNDILSEPRFAIPNTKSLPVLNQCISKLKQINTAKHIIKPLQNEIVPLLLPPDQNAQPPQNTQLQQSTRSARSTNSADISQRTQVEAEYHLVPRMPLVTPGPGTSAELPSIENDDDEFSDNEDDADVSLTLQVNIPGERNIHTQRLMLQAVSVYRGQLTEHLRVSMQNYRMTNNVVPRNQESSIANNHQQPPTPAISQEARLFLQAARNGDINDIRPYLQTNRNNSAALNIADPETGNTALLIAAQNGNHAVIDELLYTQGINREVVNRRGQTASMLAQISGHTAIALHLTRLASTADQPETSSTTSNTTNTSTEDEPVINNFENRLKNYKGEIPKIYKCPISLSIMNDPVSLSNGLTYDRESLINYFAYHKNPATLPCPVSKKIIKRYEIMFETNFTLKEIIEEFVKTHEIKPAEKTDGVVRDVTEATSPTEKKSGSKIKFFENSVPNQVSEDVTRTDANQTNEPQKPPSPIPTKSL